MRKIKIFIASAILLLTFSTVLTGQSNVKNKQVKTNTISLDEFEIEEKGLTSYYTGLLGKQMPFILSISLRKFGYQIKWTQELINQSTIDQQSKYRQKEQGADQNLLLNNKVKYSITGVFYNWNETNLDIQIFLNKVMDNGDLLLLNDYQLSTYDLYELNSSLNTIATQINRDILNSNASEKRKSLAVFCYKITPFEESKTDNYISGDMTLSVYYNIKGFGFPGIKMIDWETAKKACENNQQRTQVQHSKQLNADLLLSGKIEYLDNLGNFRVYPQIFIASKKSTITIPGPIKNKSRYYDIEKQVSEYILEVLAALIDEEGIFNKTLLSALIENNIDLKLSETQKYYYQLEFKVAATLSYSVLEIEKNNKEALLWLAKCKTELGEYDEALSICEKIETDNPLWTDIHFQKGIIFQYQENNDDALKAFYKVKELNKNYPYVNYQLGFTFYFNRDYNNAIHSFIDELKQGNKDLYSLYYLSLSYLENGIQQLNYEDKTREYVNASKIALDAQIILDEETGDLLKEEFANLRYLILQEYGVTSYKHGNYEKSVLLFTDMNNIYPDNYGLDMLRFSYSALNDFNNVDRVINQGLENNLYTDTVYFQQAQHLRAFKDSAGNYSVIKLTAAMGYLDTYLATNNNQAEALRLKGSTYFRLGLLKQAKDQYLLAHQYELNTVQKAKILLDIAEISIMKGEYNDVIKTLNKLENRDWIPGDRASNSIRCLDLYLSIAAKYMLNQNIKDEQATLEEYTKTNTLTGWSYTTFDKWIDREDNGLSHSQKKFLSSLTASMKNRTRAY